MQWLLLETVTRRHWISRVRLLDLEEALLLCDLEDLQSLLRSSKAFCLSNFHAVYLGRQPL